MEEQERKKLGIGAAVLSLLCIAAFFPLPMGDEVVLQPQEASPLPEKRNAVWQEVRGAKEAGTSKELRDPFRPEHPKREERHRVAALGTDATKAENIALDQGRTGVPNPPKELGKRAGSKQSSYVLRGVLLSDQGNLAMIEFGNQTQVLGVGEEADGMTVRQIEANAVILQGKTSEHRLLLGVEEKGEEGR